MRAAADLVWPPQSAGSGLRVDAPGRLDADDWSAIHFLDAPWCARCGLPFPYAIGEGAECPACIARPPKYAQARAAFVYARHDRDLASPRHPQPTRRMTSL